MSRITIKVLCIACLIVYYACKKDHVETVPPDQPTPPAPQLPLKDYKLKVVECETNRPIEAAVLSTYRCAEYFVDEVVQYCTKTILTHTCTTNVMGEAKLLPSFFNSYYFSLLKEGYWDRRDYFTSETKGDTIYRTPTTDSVVLKMHSLAWAKIGLKNKQTYPADRQIRLFIEAVKQPYNVGIYSSPADFSANIDTVIKQPVYGNHRIMVKLYLMNKGEYIKPLAEEVKKVISGDTTVYEIRY